MKKNNLKNKVAGSIQFGGYVPHRIFCIGRNYQEHIKELATVLPSSKSDAPPREPAIFMKPVPCLVTSGQDLHRPPYGKNLHHEVEIVVLVGREGKNLSEDQAGSYIAGITLGLDLTLRDVQNDLKKQGLPWELSKAFDGSAPIGEFVAYDEKTVNLENIAFKCSVNGVLRQQGNSGEMIFPIRTIISFLSHRWTLKPGDIIYTGTPSGVGPLASGDTITIENDWIGKFSWKVVECGGKTPLV